MWTCLMTHILKNLVQWRVIKFIYSKCLCLIVFFFSSHTILKNASLTKISLAKTVSMQFHATLNHRLIYIQLTTNWIKCTHENDLHLDDVSQCELVTNSNTCWTFYLHLLATYRQQTDRRTRSTRSNGNWFQFLLAAVFIAKIRSK